MRLLFGDATYSKTPHEKEGGEVGSFIDGYHIFMDSNSPHYTKLFYQIIMYS